MKVYFVHYVVCVCRYLSLCAMSNISEIVFTSGGTEVCLYVIQILYIVLMFAESTKCIANYVMNFFKCH